MITMAEGLWEYLKEVWDLCGTWLKVDKGTLRKTNVGVWC